MNSYEKRILLPRKYYDPLRSYKPYGDAWHAALPPPAKILDALAKYVWKDNGVVVVEKPIISRTTLRYETATNRFVYFFCAELCVRSSKTATTTTTHKTTMLGANMHVRPLDSRDNIPGLSGGLEEIASQAVCLKAIHEIMDINGMSTLLLFRENPGSFVVAGPAVGSRLAEHYAAATATTTPPPPPPDNDAGKGRRKQADDDDDDGDDGTVFIEFRGEPHLSLHAVAHNTLCDPPHVIECDSVHLPQPASILEKLLHRVRAESGNGPPVSAPAYEYKIQISEDHCSAYWCKCVMLNFVGASTYVCTRGAFRQDDLYEATQEAAARCLKSMQDGGRFRSIKYSPRRGTVAFVGLIA